MPASAGVRAAGGADAGRGSDPDAAPAAGTRTRRNADEPGHQRLSPEDYRLACEDTGKIMPAQREPKNLGIALLITLAAAVLPGSGHLALRRQTGWPILASFLLLVMAGGVFVSRVPRAKLVEYLVSPDSLTLLVIGCFIGAVLWLAVVLRTYDLAKPSRLSVGKQLLGSALVFLMCLGVGAPFAFAGYTANAQRGLLNALFPTAGGGSEHPPGDVNAIKKPRINVLLLGGDDGEGRIGTRTDTMVVASIDTRSARTVLFALPRNTSFAQFPPSSKAAAQFPNGFHRPGEPAGNYLLNAVYAYGTDNPGLAPSGPSRNPGLNLLMSSISHMLGLQLDYYIQVNMAGFASIIDALGGLDVNVGPAPVPMGGIGPFGEVVRPFGYIPAGQQHLTGDQALWFARSRTNSTDYVRMSRQRCLLQYLIDQKTPVDVLKNFQAVSEATKGSVSTNVPQDVLPALMTLAGKTKEHPLESVSFDPSLPDPEEPDGRFDTGDPNFPLIRKVVQDTINRPVSAAPTTAPTGQAGAAPSGQPAPKAPTATSSSSGAAPVSLGEVCGAPSTP